MLSSMIFGIFVGMKAVNHSTRCHDSKYQDFSDVSVTFKMICLSWVLLQCSQQSHVCPEFRQIIIY
jgi:hypothetical protein